MRPVVSYDDITNMEGSAPDPEQLGPPLPSTSQPPAKKRKMHQKAPQRKTQRVQHWDDPGSSVLAMNYTEEVSITVDSSVGQDNEDEMEEEEGESRELNHE